MNTLRWISILPAWGVGQICGYYLIVLFFGLVNRTRGTGPLSSDQLGIWAMCAGSLVSGIAGIVLAAQVVPAHRRQVSIGLATLQGVIGMGLLYGGWERADRSLVVAVSLWAFAPFFVVFRIRNELAPGRKH